MMPYETHEQSYVNSCGAASLLCAAKELGVDHFPDGRPLVIGRACEDVFFSNVGTGARGTALSDRGYSFPAKIVVFSRYLGLKNATVYMQQGFFSMVLTTFYADALKQAESAGVRIVRQKMPPLQPYQRALKVMSVMGVLGLHYVMMRPDGSYMDPADGKNYPDFASLRAPFTKSYTDTGISMVFDSEWVNLKPLTA